MDVTQLLSRGYLPEVLPLAFTSADFAAAADSLKHADGKDVKRLWMESGTVNVARPGGLRRRMSLVNPFKQRLLAMECAREWPVLQQHLGKSDVSLTKPVPHSLSAKNGRGLRYLQYELPRGDRAASRSSLLGGTRYTLQTDISNFYGSVYTHAIDWALNTKTVAKSNVGGNKATVGSILDKLVRSGQDGQTKGIPVGPDTSHLLAEVLLCELDSMLAAEHPSVAQRGLRFVDDFDYAARTYSEAESVLRSWEALLASFELTLNPLKTRIIEGPVAPEPMWKIQLRQHPVRQTSDAALANDLRSIFSIAIHASKGEPGTPSLSYAVRRLRDVQAEGRAWEELQNLLLGAITVEPSSLPYAYELLARAVWQGRTPDLDRLVDTLNEFVLHHARLEHGSEVMWALYMIHRLGASIDADAAAEVLSMSDNGSLILLRDLDAAGRVRGRSLSWDSVVARAEAPGAGSSSDWLLGYEFARHGWSSISNLMADRHWGELLRRNIAFYETPKPLRVVTPPSSEPTQGEPVLPPPPAMSPVTETSGPGAGDSNTNAVPSGSGSPSEAGQPSPSSSSGPSGRAEGEDAEREDDEDEPDGEEDLDEVEFLSFLDIDRY